VVIGADLGAELTTLQKEAITSATTLGALLGGLGAGALSDARGRKGVLFLANIVFIVGALLQAGAHAVSTMVVGRFVVGLGVGLASCIAPLYIGELAPTRMRGRLVTVNAVVCTFGQVVAYSASSPGWADSSDWCAVRARTRRMAVDGRARRSARRGAARRPRVPPRVP
jgi:SP family myo-inositol transporter-like MFS transporter 13